MKARAALLLLTLTACGDDAPRREPADPVSDCAATHTLLERVGTDTTERWCAVDSVPCGDALCGTADGRYTLSIGDEVRREGQFDDGQPSGAWIDWHSPTQRAATYSFADGLAHGDFAAWRADGTRVFERSYAAGRACGTWTSYGPDDAIVNTLDYGPCTGAGALPASDDLGLVSPRVDDFGWSGASCPSGTRVVDRDPERGGDATGVTYCERDGVADGPYRRVDGAQVLEVGVFVDGARDGRWVTYHRADSGPQRVATVGHYTAGARSGQWHFYRADGTLERRGGFVADREDGAWEGYAPNLVRAWSGSYLAGDKSGAWSTYHSDLPLPGAPSFAAAGALATEETWLDGVRHGPFTHWFDEGGKEREGDYVNGAWGGVVTTYWESGHERYATSYVGGMATGPHAAWDERGRAEAEGQYDFGARVGPWTFWIDPHPIIQRFADVAVRVQVTATFVADRLEGAITTDYEDGTRAGEGYAVDGHDEGDLTLYWPSGETLVEGFYEGGAAQGPWQSYYASGAPRATWPFARGLLTGEFLELHEGGTPKRAGRYLDDRRVGAWTTYDASGDVLRVEDCGVSGEDCDCAATEDCE